MLSDTLRRALLSKGYFPKELPPVFTTEDFGEHSADILETWEADEVFKVDSKSLGKTPEKKKRRNAHTYKLSSAEAEVLSKPKRGYERRNLHITHPIPQALLVSEISKNWKAIQKWLSRQAFSIDEIHISKDYDRAIKDINFRAHREKSFYLEAISDWLVKTDITRFYPSIYTHSIPWAAYGKERVKSSMDYYKGSFADRIDVLVRACNRNQTIGIPIGPETSRIIAEVISSRIDMDFQARELELPEHSVDRLQDDWNVGTKTLEQAEDVITCISSIYRTYGLEINGSKTSIEHIIASKRKTWLSEIGSFLSHHNGALHGARLREFITMSLRLQSEHQSEPVVSYALSVIERAGMTNPDIREVESFLLQAAVIAPGSMDKVCRIILNIQHATGAISAKRIGRRFSLLAERNLEKGHHFEVIWLLYTLRGLKRPLEAKKLCGLSEYASSSAIALILLDMKQLGMGIGTLPKAEWEGQISSHSVLQDWSWLLAYEGFRKGWLHDSKGILKEPFFAAMDKRDIVFYDPKRSIATSRSVLKKATTLRKRQSHEMRAFFAEIRGEAFDEY
ncbi:RNA-directed DNA polymerase [Sulfitobacter sp. 1A15106]|uniref:RNA-directed DNA polymerase n=1 Tax=Sulfitobacter sp. 1A15106 TaxID=3368590 RepID=UPI003745722D